MNSYYLPLVWLCNTLRSLAAVNDVESVDIMHFYITIHWPQDNGN